MEIASRGAGGSTASTIDDARCSVCGEQDLHRVVTLLGVPVNCSVLTLTAETARAVDCGDIVLAVCARCAMIRNTAFDASKLVYDGDYDNSLQFSPRFREFSQQLAGRLVDGYGLRGKTVVEIGAGDGEFLAELCRRGQNHGIGYDPASPVTAPAHGDVDLELVRELFTVDTAPPRADFVAARHVFEHLDDPRTVVHGLREAMRDVGILYAEVPDATYLLGSDEVWDVVYPHCGYFSAPALERLLADAGFEVLVTGTEFDGQFLFAEARPASSRVVIDPDDERVGRITELARRFARHFETVVEQCEALIRTRADLGRVVLWGGGAKAVTYLNVVPGADRLAAVVDVNPRKWGRYVPGTGHLVVGPDDLAADPPDCVLVMNPAYRDEIELMLKARDVECDVMNVTDGSIAR